MARSVGNGEDRAGRHDSRWRMAAWGGAVILLLLPLAAMQVSDEMNWGPFDFALAGILLFGTAFAFDLAVRKSSRKPGSLAFRAAAGLALAAVFLLIWINLAVGIIGDEGEPANLLYAGVIAVGIAGALVARGEPAALARAMLVTAGAQALAGVVALAAGWGAAGPRWPLDVLGLTVFFVALFGGAAWLFRRAAREQARAGTGPAS